MKKKDKSFGEAVAVGSAIAGAALGAAAVILSDKKNQDKIKKTIDEISNETVKIGKSIKKKADEFVKMTQKNEKKAVIKKEKKITKVVAKTKEQATARVYAPPKKV